MITEELTRQLRALAEASRHAAEARNRAVVEAHQAGATMREIGEAIGLTHVAVLRIIRRTETE